MLISFSYLVLFIDFHFIYMQETKAIKMKFHDSSFLVASSWHPCEDVANMSRGNLGVGRVG